MSASLTYRSIDSPLGELFLAEAEARLCRIAWCTAEAPFATGLEEQWGKPARRQSASGNSVLEEAARQLEEYFGGQRRAFELPLDLSPLREFHRHVLTTLLQVPFGEVVSYGELAVMAGYPGAARAVGGAMRGNPLPIVVPCHRVLMSDGSLGGFGGRPEIKRRLLELEGSLAPTLGY